MREGNEWDNHFNRRQEKKMFCQQQSRQLDLNAGPARKSAPDCASYEILQGELQAQSGELPGLWLEPVGVPVLCPVALSVLCPVGVPVLCPVGVQVLCPVGGSVLCPVGVPVPVGVCQTRAES
jgi:hypothetical protein